jgi:Haem-binding domain
MKTRAKWIFGGVAVAVVLLQFIRPDRTSPPVLPGHDLLAIHPPPPEIAAMLRAACYDCHSFETKWPWYSRVAPVSWWLAGHVKGGRKQLNFSEWAHDDPQRAQEDLDDIGKMLRSGKMPLPSYTYLGLHAAARLTPAQREQLANWADQEADRVASGNMEK